jgi:hypothetical protein
MDDKNKDLSVKIMELLKPILPKGVGFIMITGQADTLDLGVTSNLPDHVALSYLEGAMESIKVDPAIDLEEPLN